MPTFSFPYPLTPTGVPATVTEPSAAFKRQVVHVMAAILLFLIVYLLMLALSVVLIAACFYGGVMIMSSLRGMLAILGGIGLIGLGIMVFIFLIKFLFAVSKFDKSNSVELKEEEQPELFAFVRQVAKDTQAPFPKKIFLSADVNAAVFYDSSFWSMFFPVRKNLLIGLGLVNTVNLSEFKAVIAHEFGHFSQRSMKLGSFVYNVNRIIYNMLYENKSYGSALNTWAEVHGVFALFASITVAIARAIQWVLQQMYGVINKSYMALSREMEFHADAVAASVSGSSSLVSALRRVELGQLSYSTVLDKCNDLYREKKYLTDVFSNQQVVLKQLTTEFKLEVDNGLPLVNDGFLAQSNASRLNIKDQWASHPSLEDREKHLNDLGVMAEEQKESAWVIFRDREHWQQRLTKIIYRDAAINDEMKSINTEEFSSWFHQSIHAVQLPEQYNGYYDGRLFYLPSEEEQADLLTPTTVNGSFDEIYSSSHVSLNKQIQSATGDLQVLRLIETNEYPVKSFDFDGVKYGKEEAARIAANLEKEIADWGNTLKQTDLSSIKFFISHAKDPQEIIALYQDYFAWRRDSLKYLDTINQMLRSLEPLTSGPSLSAEQAHTVIGELKNEHEPAFKKGLEQWMKAGVFDNETAVKEMAVKFLSVDYAYFTGTEFFNDELNTLDTLARDSWAAVSIAVSVKFKHLLQFQLEHLEKKAA